MHYTATCINFFVVGVNIVNNPCVDSLKVTTLSQITFVHRHVVCSFFVINTYYKLFPDVLHIM